jgi:ABC-type glycerol-3-phosphate transport system permease component
VNAYQSRQRRIIEHLLLYVALLAILVILLFPIYWIIVTSFKTPTDSFRIPPVWIFTPVLDNYRQAFTQMPLLSYFWNSVLISVIEASLVLVVASLAAYPLARLQFRGMRPLMLWILGTQMIPPVVIIIPLFFMFFRLGLTGTYQSIIIAHAAFLLPFSIWLLRGFFMDVPRELEESAMVDGASRLEALVRIVLPLAAPGLATVWILSLIFAWNDFLIPLALANEATKTLPLAVAGFRTDRGIEWGPAAAAGTITVVPVLLFALLMQRFIISGLTRGAIRG